MQTAGRHLRLNGSFYVSMLASVKSVTSYACDMGKRLQSAITRHIHMESGDYFKHKIILSQEKPIKAYSVAVVMS